MKESIKKHANQGFTLVELIIVIAIMSILASAIGISVVRYIDKARQSIDINNAKLIKDAVTAYAYPSNYPGESISFTDTETNETETFNRGWVYVDQKEIRCSDASVALAMIDAGLVTMSDESVRKMQEAEENGTRWFPSSADGDFVYKSSINEYVFKNKLTVKTRIAWNTYQIDVYIKDNGELVLGASASNEIRTNGHAKDEKTAKKFAQQIGLDGSRVTPIGNNSQ